MSGLPKHRTWIREHRVDRLIEEPVHDPYRSQRKLKQPTACPDCGAVYDRGHWIWSERPEGAEEAVCPACRRIQEHAPAGFLTASGGFLDRHLEEITRLIRNVEEREKTQHPLKRIMWLEQTDGALEVTFTDPHLARGAGDALHHAFQGELHYAYVKGDYLLRVTWRRDD